MSKPVKVKQAKQYTRAQAERALRNGADPNLFFDVENPLAKKDPKNPGNTVNHGNFHVRLKAWIMLGRPLPEDTDARAKILKSLHLTTHNGEIMTLGKAQSLQPTKEESA